MTTARRLPAKGKTMEALLTLVPSRGTTRLLLTRGKDVLLRGRLPPLKKVCHPRAVVTLLEALALWTNSRLCVALYAGDPADSFRLELTDELGLGTRGVYYSVEVEARRPHDRHAVAEGAVGQHRSLMPVPGGAR